MSEVCNDSISSWELLGRTLSETSQINKQGVVKPKAMYPKLHQDKEKGRENLFSNKLSVMRLCRGHNDGLFSWHIHKTRAEGFVTGTDNIFRGFLLERASTIIGYDLEIVEDGHEKNPYHAHIIIPDFNVRFSNDFSMIADVIPASIRGRLDRLRMHMKTVILNRGERYPANLTNVSPNDSICNICPLH